MQLNLERLREICLELRLDFILNHDFDRLCKKCEKILEVDNFSTEVRNDRNDCLNKESARVFRVIFIKKWLPKNK